MFTQPPCDHEEPCACYAQGHSDGREQAHEELRGWDHEAHDPDCNCGPCLTSAAVLMAFMPGLVPYPDLRTLYTERGGAGTDEIVCGYFNYDGREPPVKLAGMLRVAYNCGTGDWYRRAISGRRTSWAGTDVGSRNSTPSGAGGPFMAITETDCPVCAQIGATAQSLGSEGGLGMSSPAKIQPWPRGSRTCPTARCCWTSNRGRRCRPTAVTGSPSCVTVEERSTPGRWSG